jgi:hypothetical protein
MWGWLAPQTAVCLSKAFSRDQVVLTMNVGDFMTLAAGMDVHPGVIALREAELNAQDQWLRLHATLAYAEEACGGDLLNRVLEVQADGLFVLHTIPI